MKKAILLVIASTLLFAVMNCTKNPDITGTYTPVTGLKLNKNRTTLAFGASETITWTITPASATEKSVSASSKDKKVATIDDNGKITATGVGGTTLTIANNDGFGSGSDTINVTVTAIPATAIAVAYKYHTDSLDKYSITKIGDTATFEATLTPLVTSSSFSWRSDNSNIATVDAKGFVTAILNGTVNIYAISSDDNRTVRGKLAITIP